jgi:uncharacterized cupredoxin-like copper-binding protein
MSAPTIPEDPLATPEAGMPVEERIEARLARLEQRVERGNHEGRRAGRSFSIFAVAALVVALGNLVAVAATRDSGSSSVQPARSGPMMSSPATAPAAAAARNVTVSLREYSIAPSSSVGRAGRVTFAVRNAGTIPHEFVVVRTDKAAGDLLKGAKADETGNVGETGDLAPGQAKTINLSLKPGHYALICNLPGHYAAGQHTDFTVR